MKKELSPPRLPVWGVVLISWMVCFALACTLASYTRAGETPGEGMLERMIGALRPVVAAGFVEKADVYFHRGVGRQEAHDDSSRDFFRRWGEQLNPVEHKHLHDREAVEMLPWLLTATALDPANPETWLTAAYWVERAGGTREQVETVFREARQALPRLYRIPERLASYRIRIGAPADAEPLLKQAAHLWPEGESDPSHAQHDLAHIYVRWALLKEGAGDTDTAIDFYRQALSAWPNHRMAQNRLTALERNTADPEDARAILDRLATDEMAKHTHACGREHH